MSSVDSSGILGPVSGGYSGRVPGGNSAKNVVYASYGSVFGDVSGLPLEAQVFLMKLKRYSIELSDTIVTLMLRTYNDGYERLKAMSDNEGVVEVNARFSASGGVERAGEPRAPVSITVERVATAQQSESGAVDSFGSVFETDKTYDLTIRQNGAEKSFSVKSRPFVYNWSVMRKLADDINKSEIGITAEIANGKKTSRLVLTGGSTGAEAAFETYGALADALGMRVLESADDAVYRVNGGERNVSRSNNVRLPAPVSEAFGAGESGEEAAVLNLTLKAASEAPVTISFENDTSDVKRALNELVKNYNSLMTLSGYNTPGYRNQSAYKLRNQLANLGGYYEAQLAAAGLDVRDDGRLALNAGRVDDSVANGALARLFGGGGSSASFGQRLGALAKKAADDPGAYIVGEHITAHDSSGMLYDDMF